MSLNLVGSPTAAMPAKEVYGVTLPRQLDDFVLAIEQSRAMLELGDNWDDEGSPGYQEQTWRVAVSLAVQTATVFLATHHIVPPSPAIAKGPEGSVDVVWSSGTRKIMINVPGEDDQPVTYHGYDREHASREIKGLLDPADKNEWVLAWLTE